MDDFNKAITLKPDFADAYHDRGFVKMMNGDLEGALIDCGKANEINPDDFYAYKCRAMTEAMEENWLGAEMDLTKVIALKPPVEVCADAYNYRGVAKTHKGDLDGAIADFSQSLELRPISPDTVRNLNIVRAAKINQFQIDLHGVRMLAPGPMIK